MTLALARRGRPGTGKSVLGVRPVARRQELSDFDLRVTTTFRVEDGTWTIVHRHADPITTLSEDGPLRQ